MIVFQKWKQKVTVLLILRLLILSLKIQGRKFNFTSLFHKSSVDENVIKSKITQKTPSVNTVVNLFPGANF